MQFKRKQKVNQRITIGTTVMEIVIWGCKLSVVWSQMAFDGSANVSPKNEISDHKTDDLLPQMAFLITVIP